MGTKLIIQTADGQQHELSPRLGELVEEIATRDSISLEQALAQALTNEQVLADLEAHGAKILYSENDGQLRELVRKPLVAA